MNARFCCDNRCARGLSCPAHEEGQAIRPEWAAHAASEFEDEPPVSYGARVWIAAVALALTPGLLLTLFTRVG